MPPQSRWFCSSLTKVGANRNICKYIYRHVDASTDITNQSPAEYWCWTSSHGRGEVIAVWRRLAGECPGSHSCSQMDYYQIGFLKWIHRTQIGSAATRSQSIMAGDSCHERGGRTSTAAVRCYQLCFLHLDESMPGRKECRVQPSSCQTLPTEKE